jgi:ubiquinone/menaquinone biosynthesis C-methylase UbiE
MIKRRIIFPFITCLSLILVAGAPDELIKKSAPRATSAPATKPVPPALTHYMGREIAQTMHWAGAGWLTREEREKEEDCATMVKMLKVKQGQVVCDLGAGNGFYTIWLAKLVGEKGKVLAVDIQPEMLEMLKTRAEREKVANIDLILGTTVDPKLPEGKLDLVLVVDTYHELSNPVEVLAAVRKSLKPDGRLALVEFRLEDDTVPIKVLHRMSKDQIMKEFTANGFKLVDQFDGLPWQHLMFFSREEK